MTSKRPPPCRCERLAFPHRHEWRCEEFAEDELASCDPPDDTDMLGLISDRRADLPYMNGSR